jgi:hypothetical protein
VHLADDAPGTASVTAHGTANVADVTLSPTATTTPTEAAGFPFTTTVANFSDANPLATSTDFSATIDWGDGTTSSGTASGPTGGPFSISGSHTYAAPGSYAVAVTITDGTQQVVAHSTINVPLTCPPGANVLSGSLAGTIIIGPNSNTCLKGATTSGGVIVQRGATATIVNSSIGGSVSSSGAATFAMCNTSTVGGVSVSGTTGDTTVGDDTELCNGNTIHSSLILSSDTGGLEAFANAVSGSGTMISDTGAATPAEDTIPEIEQNGFGGGLSCSGITPAPTNDGVANTAPSKGGQCAGL